MKRIFNEIKSFRLGYTEERAYPWRWTTPIVLCAFLLISPLLALVNVPLSAYNIVQEATYQPNDTLPTVFLGNIVPSVLQNPTDNFTPQLLNVGYTIFLDDYIFNYTIAQAFDGADTSKPVNITAWLHYVPGTGSAPDLQFSGTVACYSPTLFYLTWAGLPSDQAIDRMANEEINFMSLPFAIKAEIGTMFLISDGPGMNLTEVDLSFTVHPCCDCDAVLAGGALENSVSLLQSPCSSNPPHFVVVDIPLFTSGPLLHPPVKVADLLADVDLGNVSLPNLGTAYENLFQMLYHLVRLDLGVILDNQIFNSPEMFNHTIMDTENFGFANEARISTSNTTLMAHWQTQVEFFQNNTRVPLLEYLRSVPRLKPLGSAMTSVFVSTFAMLSVIWTVFSLDAGALARKNRDKIPKDTEGKKHTLGQPRRWNKRLESGMEDVDGSEVILIGPHKEPDAVAQLRQEGVQMRVSLTRMRAALIKHGIMENEELELHDDDTTVE
ncbi:hypothetical protein C8R45DRAFT_1212345 [Mycena sanguinolenta]|nr:hypothetical protein C8R45DRAFT_1212345 [Mycena sanguinolenta]